MPNMVAPALTVSEYVFYIFNATNTVFPFVLQVMGITSSAFPHNKCNEIGQPL